MQTQQGMQKFLEKNPAVLLAQVRLSLEMGSIIVVVLVVLY